MQNIGFSYYKLNSYDLNKVKGVELIRSVEIDQVSGFYLVPNPASGYLHDHYIKIYNQIISIYSIDGKRLKVLPLKKIKKVP